MRGLKRKHGWVVAGLLLAIPLALFGLVREVLSRRPLVTRRPLRVLQVGRGANGVHSVAFSPDGLYLAGAGDNGDAGVWDARTGRVLQNLPCLWVDFTGKPPPDSRSLALGGFLGEIKGSWVQLMDSRTGQVRRIVKTDQMSVESMAFAPNGGVLASGSYNGTVKLWDSN